jgi:hypothetical protein
MFNATVYNMWISCEGDNRMMRGDPVTLFLVEGESFAKTVSVLSS